MTKLKSDLINLQRSIYKELKKKAYELEGDISDEIIQYRAEQIKYASRNFSLTNDKELITCILRSQVVYLGDFHSFDQSSRNLVRLLQLGNHKSQKISIGVEFVDSEHQNKIDAYLNGFISEYEFLDEINYSETWRFPWSHYRIFFELSKKYGFNIHALNTKGTLSERDENAAKKIADILKKDSRQRLYVLFGELHIIPNKIPLLTSKIAKNIKQCIIHQNLDEIYWEIHKDDIDNDSYLIKFNEFEFSLQTSPPWTKYESMIYWYEHLSMNLDFDAYDHFTSPPPPEDLLENMIFYAKQASKILGLKQTIDSLEDINLYDHQDLDFISEEIQKIKNSDWKLFIENMITLGHSFMIPNSNIYYCSSYSVNRISHIAGMHLFAIQGQSIPFDENKSPLQVEFFIYYFKQETIAYFTSKVINPFLKCDLYHDLTVKNPKSLALDIINENKENKEKNTTLKDLLSDHNLIECFSASRVLGRYCGEMLYENIMPNSIKEYQQLKNYLFSQCFDEKVFFDRITQLIPPGDYLRHKKRFF